MENNKRKNKGITLVALVVTIIILLILAGISISALTQTGLFGKAKLAKEKYKNAQEKENVTLSDYSNNINQEVITSDRALTNNEVLGKSNKKFKIEKNILEDENEGYIPILTSNNSSNFGIASSNIPNAWLAFDNNNNTYTYYESENISNSYVEFSTKGILMYIKKVTASVMTTGKSYNYYLQYLNKDNNQWITVNEGKISPCWENPIKIEGELNEAIYTTAIRIYTDTIKTSGNNFSVVSIQAYP